MGRIIRIDGPASAHMNEFLSLRSVVSPDMSPSRKRRLKWTVTSGTYVKRYEGEAVRHLVARDAADVTITVKDDSSGDFFTRRLQVVRLNDESELLAGVVSVSPIPERIAPQSFAKNQLPVFSATVGSGPVLLVGWLFQPRSENNAAPLRNGIFTRHATADARYKAADHLDLGFWTQIIEPTVRAEGEGSFTAVNTWDRATFTFGLIQFGAHTYGDNFHELFRRMLHEHSALIDKYFPEYRLVVVDGRQEIYGCRHGRWLQLTTSKDKSNAAFREFIKPISSWVTSSEISFAARLSVVTRLHPELQRLQVLMAKESGIRKFKELDLASANIDGQPDHVCAWVFDIRNQGRGGKHSVELAKAALAAGDPVAELRKIGANSVEDRKRIERVGALIQAYLNSGVFGRKKFNVGSGDFEDL